MAVYIVTGKLGSGKSLACVGKIRDALIRGAPVATNLDIRLHKLMRTRNKKATVYRLPDKPTADDMKMIGSGNDSYDEEKNGLIVLDECGTWFNSRDWQDKGRKALINWLLHARKLGWDVMLIIQDIALMDKQARKSVAEYVVYCRRLDRALKIPLIEPLFKILTGKRLPKPKVHLGVVRYGDQPTSPAADGWWYLGHELYPAYDTKQAYTDDYPHGLYQVLPPYYSHGRYQVPRNWRFYMRLTKIYFKRFSKVAMLAFGIIAGSAIASYIQKPEPIPVEPPHVVDQPETAEPDTTPEATSEPIREERPPTVAERFEGFIVSGVAAGPDGEPIYVQIGNGESHYNLQGLRASGYVVRMVSQCEVLIMNQARTENTRLYTSYCPSHDGTAQPPRMSAEQRYRWRLAQLKAEEQSLQ